MKIKTKRVTYILNDITELNKVNILQGDSGTGKTRLYELCTDLENKVYGCSCDSNTPIFTLSKCLTSDMCNNELCKTNNSLIILDEDSPFFKQDWGKIQNIIYSSTNTYIIIQREKKFNSMSIAIDSIFVLVSQGSYVLMKRKYNLQLNALRTNIHPDSIITEDSNSGYYFFKRYFNGINIISARGKDKVYDKLLQTIHKGHKGIILVVVDSCAFGLCYEHILYLTGIYSGIYILAWKCFEEYILRSSNLNILLPNSSMESDYLDVLSSCISYNKESLTHCLNPSDKCSECKKFRECKYVVYTSRRANYIHSELLLLEESKISEF